MHTGPQALAEGLQDDAHRASRDARQHQRDILSPLRVSGRREPRPGKALVEQARRALAPLGPAMAGPAFVPDSGFIPDPQLHVSPGVRLTRCGEPEGQLLF